MYIKPSTTIDSMPHVNLIKIRAVIVGITILFIILMGVGSATASESNDYPSGATFLALNVAETGEVDYSGGDPVDWWKVYVSTAGTLTVSLDIITAGENLDLKVYSTDTTTSLCSSTSTSNQEQCSASISSAGDYYVKVYAYDSGDVSGYSLSNSFISDSTVDDSMIADLSTDNQIYNASENVNIVSSLEIEPSIKITPSTQIVLIGEPFAIDVMVDPVGLHTAGLQFNLNYNSSIVTVNSVTEGDFLNQNGVSTFFNPGTIDNIGGFLTNVYGVILGHENVTTSGTFATISMTANSPGFSPLDLSNIIVCHPNGSSIPIIINSGSVSILGELLVTKLKMLV